MSDACVITGAELVTALGAGLDTVWAGMMRKTSGIRPMQRFPRGRFRTDVAAEIPAEVEEALEAPPGPRVCRLSLWAGGRVLEGAPCDRRRTGLVLSTTKADLDGFELAMCGGPWPEHYDPFALARALAEAWGLGGPVLAVSNACASGLVAVAQAARMLEYGDADHVLVVGVDVLSEFILAGFSSLAGLSPAPCRPFDANRTGLSLGEGAGALLLSRESRCDSPGLGVIRGWGVANDAHHLTGPSPTGEGLKRALRAALAMAGAEPDAVHYVNAHGTGTVYNDAMELKAAEAVFGADAPPLTSMKGFLGHTLGGSGVIELALCLKVISEQTVPASLGLETQEPDTTAHIPSDSTTVEGLSTVLSMKSGFGGINAAVVVSREPT